MEAKTGLPRAWISVCSDCLASDRFECFDEFGERDRQALLLLGPETLERIADVQAGPAPFPPPRLPTLAPPAFFGRGGSPPPLRAKPGSGGRRRLARGA